MALKQVTLADLQTNWQPGNAKLKHYPFGLICSKCGHPSSWHGSVSHTCYWDKGIKGGDCTCYAQLEDQVNPAMQSSSKPKKLAKPRVPKTQKVKGLWALATHERTVHELAIANIFSVKKPVWYNAKATLKTLTTKPEASVYEFMGKFIRGCPVRPRHGFVDSKLVNTREELVELLVEIVKADPKAEFMVSPFIKAGHSAVWTPGLLAIGPGHDGATGGKQAVSVTVDQGSFIGEAILQKAGVTQAPYLEVVDRTITQLRDGPKVEGEGGVDFIPKEVVVKQVIKADGSLLAWEKLIQGLKGEGCKGVVVWNPGGTKVDHYSVHARTMGVPVVISHEPQVGEKLERIKGDSVKPDYAKVRRGFLWGVTASEELGYDKAALFMVAGAHLSAVWQGREDFLLGVSMGLGYKLGLMALLGELRHMDHVLPEKHWNYTTQGAVGRSYVYDKAWSDISLLEEMQGKVGRFWSPKWVTANDESVSDTFVKWVEKGKNLGVGGPKWGECGLVVLALGEAILVNEDVQAGALAFNKMVNLAHNGGWLFNKFLDASEFNLASAFPVLTLFKILKLVYQLKKVEASAWEAEKEFKFIPLQVSEEEVTLSSGVKVVKVAGVDDWRGEWKEVGVEARQAVEVQNQTPQDPMHPFGCSGCGEVKELTKGWKKLENDHQPSPTEAAAGNGDLPHLDQGHVKKLKQAVAGMVGWTSLIGGLEFNWKDKTFWYSSEKYNAWLGKGEE